MDEVRQAHLFGNYELYNENSEIPGPPICKFCWEKEGVRNSSSLETVWLVAGGQQSVWWLCRGHHQQVGQDATRRILRSEGRVVRYPPIGRAGA